MDNEAFLKYGHADINSSCTQAHAAPAPGTGIPSPARSAGRWAERRGRRLVGVVYRGVVFPAHRSRVRYLGQRRVGDRGPLDGCGSAGGRGSAAWGGRTHIGCVGGERAAGDGEARGLAEVDRP